jgi:hypothetical protein
MKTMRIYPLSKATDPPAMIFLNGSGEPIDTIFPDNYEYFESLAAVVEKEPVDAISPSDRFLFASIGIEKGKPFAPDANAKQLLSEAARAGAARSPANTFASRDPSARVYPDRAKANGFICPQMSRLNSSGRSSSVTPSAAQSCRTGKSFPVSANTPALSPTPTAQ